jgi:hypothetical protein
MTGELVLQQLRSLQTQKQFAARLAAAMVKQGIERLVEARDAFEDEGGHVHSWKDEVTGRRFCQLVLKGERVALASSDQTSADAETHAFQNLNNNRYNSKG